MASREHSGEEMGGLLIHQSQRLGTFLRQPTPPSVSIREHASANLRKPMRTFVPAQLYPTVAREAGGRTFPFAYWDHRAIDPAFTWIRNLTICLKGSMGIQTQVWGKTENGPLRCGDKGTLLHCWWACKLVQPLWKTVWRFLRKLKIISHMVAIIYGSCMIL